MSGRSVSDSTISTTASSHATSMTARTASTPQEVTEEYFTENTAWSIASTSRGQSLQALVPRTPAEEARAPVVAQQGQTYLRSHVDTWIGGLLSFMLEFKPIGEDHIRIWAAIYLAAERRRRLMLFITARTRESNGFTSKVRRDAISLFGADEADVDDAIMSIMDYESDDELAEDEIVMVSEGWLPTPTSIRRVRPPSRPRPPPAPSTMHTTLLVIHHRHPRFRRPPTPRARWSRASRDCLPKGGAPRKKLTLMRVTQNTKNAKNHTKTEKQRPSRPQNGGAKADS